MKNTQKLLIMKNRKIGPAYGFCVHFKPHLFECTSYACIRLTMGGDTLLYALIKPREGVVTLFFFIYRQFKENTDLFFVCIVCMLFFEFILVDVDLFSQSLIC